MRALPLAPSLLAALLLAPAAAPAAEEAPPLLGFGAAAASAQRDLERRYDAALDPANLRPWMERLAARPHHLGSPGSKANADFIAAQFRAWGYETRIEEFQVLMPTPRTRRLELLAPRRFVAKLTEPPLAGQSRLETGEQLPPYNAYSVDGDATGELVYVNYGLPTDYEELARRGIDVAGKIVIARYGASWRGIKPKVAAERGALACIIYSDPRGEGYTEGDSYPRGGWRSADAVQRGSVADMPLYAGDPLTPGRPATADAERLPVAEAPTLTRIPVLPISWSDARPLLEALGGPVAPEAWRGALPITYRLGPGPARVRLQVAFDWSLATAYDVIAVLPGAELPDQWIVRGNHHDAWVNGATDPVSGMVAMMEEARAIAGLAEDGWRPRRTLVYAAWDGEEQGLLGSTEWAEAHAEELRAKAVVYINSDSNSRGLFSAAGSHSLERFVNQVARDVDDPRLGVAAATRLRAWLEVHGDERQQREARERTELRLPALGSGSDYTPFLQHLGLAALNLDWGGEGHYGQYHSAYDTIDHYVRFMDPGFRYGHAQARSVGRAVLRLAQAEVLPFDFTAVADAVAIYLEEVRALADALRRETEEGNRRIRERVLELADDPDLPFVTPAEKPAVPHLNFAPLQNAAQALEASATRWAAAWNRAGEPAALPAARRAALDRALMGMERALTREEGLPGRPWYRHQVYAPGLYTGYGVKTLPAVREAIELRRFAEAEEQIEVLADVLAGYTARLDEATALVAE
jgi:N-acetylated-alpha-linked acidic dipeptidase